MYNSRTKKCSWNTFQSLYRHPAPFLAVVKLKTGYFKHNYWTQRPNYHPKLLVVQKHIKEPTRGYALLVAQLVKGVLKVRYLVLGGAIGGGYSLQKKYEEWKNGLPDMKWIESMMPNNNHVDGFKEIMTSFNDKLSNIEIGNTMIKQYYLEEKVPYVVSELMLFMTNKATSELMDHI